jgi:hypothetical protein
MNIAHIDVIMQNMLLLYVLTIFSMPKVHYNNLFFFDVQHVQQMMCSVLLCSVFAVQRYDVQQKHSFSDFYKNYQFG